MQNEINITLLILLGVVLLWLVGTNRLQNVGPAWTTLISKPGGATGSW